MALCFVMLFIEARLLHCHDDNVKDYQLFTGHESVNKQYVEIHQPECEKGRVMSTAQTMRDGKSEEGGIETSKKEELYLLINSIHTCI